MNACSVLLTVTLAKPVSAATPQPVKLTLAMIHARLSYEATSKALERAIESDALKNNGGDDEVMTQVTSCSHTTKREKNLQLSLTHLTSMTLQVVRREKGSMQSCSLGCAADREPDCVGILSSHTHFTFGL